MEKGITGAVFVLYLLVVGAIAGRVVERQVNDYRRFRSERWATEADLTHRVQQLEDQVGGHTAAAPAFGPRVPVGSDG